MSILIEPYFAEIHRRCCAQPIGLNRYSGDEREWVLEEALT